MRFLKFNILVKRKLIKKNWKESIKEIKHLKDIGRKRKKENIVNLLSIVPLTLEDITIFDLLLIYLKIVFLIFFFVLFDCFEFLYSFIIHIIIETTYFKLISF